VGITDDDRVHLLFETAIRKRAAMERHDCHERRHVAEQHQRNENKQPQQELLHGFGSLDCFVSSSLPIALGERDW
jgi:hypothetical protein